MSSIFSYFTLFSIFIACLGLFGLASYTASRRTKEIGIRKVLGATVPGIMFFLSKEYIKWIILANVIAWPAVYFIMNKWLQNFAYRTGVNILLFIFTGILALVITIFTVSYQTIRDAKKNPVDSLRYE